MWAIGLLTLVLAAGALLAQPSGDPANGKAIFEGKGTCTNCNRIIRVVSKNGTTTIGRLLNEDTFSLQMIDKTERLLSFQKADLREYAFETKSPMPSFKDRLTAQEVADLVAYLSTFKPPPGLPGRSGATVGAPPAPAAH